MKRYTELFYIFSYAMAALLLISCGGDDDHSPPSSTSTPINSLVACQSIGAKIFGGQVCSNDATASSVVQIISKVATANRALSCSGTAISSNLILTAAHCVTQVNGLVIVAVGENYFPVTNAYMPYQSTRGDGIPIDDIAILRTRSPHGIPTLPLLTSRAVQKGEIATTAGFGESSRDGTWGILQAAEVQIVHIDENVIVSEGKSVPCLGDSGGPLLVQSGGSWAIAGIISSGTTQDGGCMEGNQTFYTSLLSPRTKEMISTIMGNGL